MAGDGSEEEDNEDGLPAENAADHCHQDDITEPHGLAFENPCTEDANGPDDATTCEQPGEADEESVPVGVSDSEGHGIP